MLNASLHGTQSGQCVLSTRPIVGDHFELRPMDIWLSRGRSEAPYLRDIMSGLLSIGLTMQGFVAVDKEGVIMQITSEYALVRS
jgi:hypothetical protein